MKKLILFAAILFVGASVVSAQSIQKGNVRSINHTSVKEGTQESASTRLTVQLNSIQSISVNTSNVALVYTTVEDYTRGVSTGIINNHLEVNSTGGYKVDVIYSNPNDDASAGSIGLDANAMFQSINVAVTKKEGAFANVNDTKLLAVTGGPIISSSKGVFGAMFDVDYQGGTNYANSIKGGADARTFTADVVYTISPL